MAKRNSTNRQPANAKRTPAWRRASKDSGKDKYPLLSGVDMQDGVGSRPGLVCGLFSPTENDIGDIHSILKGMDGNTDNRESIPSPFSQTEAFQITLRDYAGQEKSKIAEGQWRGAMCLALLYPILLQGTSQPFWYKGTLDKNIRFIRLVDECRDLHSMELYTLCVEHKGKPYPLLYFSRNCGVVPVAFGIEEGICDLPWLVRMEATASTSEDSQAASVSKSKSTKGKAKKDRLGVQYFQDPRKHLSLGQLRLLRDGMALFREEYRGVITTAVIDFQKDIDADIRAMEAEDPYLKAEAQLLLGLMLRNTEDLGLRVLQRKCRTVLLDQVPRLCKFSGELCAPVQYLVLLNNTIVAYLDEGSLLCSVNPQATLMAAQGKAPSPLEALQTKLDTLLQGNNGQPVALNSLVQNQLAGLQAGFANAPVLSVLEEGFPAKISNTEIVLPWRPIGVNEDEVALKGGNYDGLALQVVVQGDPNTLFSPVLMYYEADDSYPQEDNKRAVTKINQHGGNTIYTFLPVGTFGGTALVQNDSISVTTVAVDGGHRLTFKATIRVQDNNLIYEDSRIYSENQLRKLDAGKLPCLALWADVLESRNVLNRHWQLYYVFACFPPDQSSRYYTTEVYDHRGQMVPLGNQVNGTLHSGGMPMWWRIYRMDAKPGFILYRHNGIPAGIIKLQPTEQGNPKLLFHQNTRMQLAIDFGTTASIAATRLGQEAPIMVDGLDNNRLTWLLNKSEGITYAERYFIPGQLFSGSGRATLVPTMVQRFSHLRGDDWPFGDEVHIDGNIYYPSDIGAPDLEGKNIYSGFKILLTCDRAHDQKAVQTQISNTRIFIKQMLHMYLLLSRMRGVSHLDVFFAMPIAFSAGEKIKLKEILSEAVKEVASRTGFDSDVDVAITTESRAVGTYFKHSAINNLDYDGVFTLDIGGGTSDYSVWERGNAGIAATVCCSNRLAGNEIFSALLYGELIDTGKITMLPSALGALQLPDGLSDTHYKSLADNLRSLKPNTIDSNMLITQWVDRLFIQYSVQMEQALVAPACVRLLGMINLQLALLFWIGRLVFGTLLTRSVGKVTKPVTICLAGNGANFYRLLPQLRKDGLIKVFETIGTPLDVFLRRDRREQKTEVVQGLLMDENIFHEPENDEAETLGKLDPKVVWESLLKMLKAYVTVFTEGTMDDPIASDLALLLDKPELVESMQANVYKHAQSLDTLNRHLLPLKNQLVDYLGEIAAVNKTSAHSV